MPNESLILSFPLVVYLSAEVLQNRNARLHVLCIAHVKCVPISFRKFINHVGCEMWYTVGIKHLDWLLSAHKATYIERV